jgi:hypothetical protein
MPAIAPNSTQQFFAETCKVFGSISDLNHEPSIDLKSYEMELPLINSSANIQIGNISSGSFYIGIDLENYQASDKSQVYSGYNSSTDDIYCVMNFENNTAEQINIRFDAFACYDQELVFENNTSYVKF